MAYWPHGTGRPLHDIVERFGPTSMREAAHNICPLLFAFSTVAGNVGSDLEDHAAEGRIKEAQPLVERLGVMARELMRLVDGLSLESLRRQAGAADDR